MGAGHARTAEALQAELEKEGQAGVIGPAGENWVRYACVMTGTRHAAGRTGMGAVMGSKNLKAIAVRGDQRPGKPDEDARQAARLWGNDPQCASLRDLCPLQQQHLCQLGRRDGRAGDAQLPGRAFEGAEQIDGKRLIDYVTRARTCHRCPVHCKAEIEIREGRYAGTRGERPDIEPIINLGSKCGLDDPEAVLYLYNLTGDAGPGRDLRWRRAGLCDGAVPARHPQLRGHGRDGADLGRRRGDGGDDRAHRAARGVWRGVGRRARGARPRSLAGERQAYAHHSKGLELTGYDPRGLMGSALGYAVSTRGGDFTSVYAAPEYRWDAGRGAKSGLAPSPR